MATDPPQPPDAFPEWVDKVRERIEQPGHKFLAPEGRPCGDMWWHQEEAVMSEEEELLGGEGGASRPPTREERVKMYERVTMKAGLKLASFEPLRQTTMICGRPVQVAMLSFAGFFFLFNAFFDACSPLHPHSNV